MNDSIFLSAAAPFPASVRFMIHVWGIKPHLDRIHGQWRCVGRHIYAYGPTPQVAMGQWTRECDAREDWEQRR